MNCLRVTIYIIIVSFILAFTSAFAKNNPPVQDSGMRNLDSIQANIISIEQSYVEAVLAAYVEGIELESAGHPTVMRWREKLITQTDSVALANRFHPRNVRDSIGVIIDEPDPLIVDLILRVWQRLERESKTTKLSSKPVLRNVSVPGNSIYPSGIDPSAIEDPELRADYEQAILENEQRAAQLNRVMEFHQAYELYVRRASRVLRKIGLNLSAEDRESLLLSRLRDSGLQGSEELLEELQSP